MAFAGQHIVEWASLVTILSILSVTQIFNIVVRSTFSAIAG
jgi:hypothetical protein